METLKADLATLNDIVSRLTQDLKNTIELEGDDFNSGRIEKLKDSSSFAQLSDGTKKRISVLLPEVPAELHSASTSSLEDSYDEDGSDDDVVKREESSVNGDVEEEDDDGRVEKREEKEDGEGEDGEGVSAFSGNKSGKSQTPGKTPMRRVTPRRSNSGLKSFNPNEQSRSSTPCSVEIFDGELAASANSANFKEQAMAIWRTVNQHKFAVVFRKPVNLKDAPGYIEVVKEPMDLSLIKTRIENGNVQRLDELARLFDLMCENAMKYNGRGDEYYAYAKEIKAHARAAIHTAKTAAAGAAQIVQSPNLTRSALKRKRNETSDGEKEHEETTQEDGDDQGATTTRRKRAAAAIATPRLSERRRRRK